VEENLITVEDEIKNKIYSIRGKQVMLDRDLAELYEVKAIRLREQVKRNKIRFPEDFMFQLTDNEIEFMVSQNAIPSKKHLGGSKPYAFSEQGVSMLSAVLKTKIAIDMSVKIMRTFIELKNFYSNNSTIFNRISNLEEKQITTDLKIEKVLNLIESKEIRPKQGIFFDGQIFDAYEFVADLIRSAKKNIKLIDNYVDDTVLTLFSKNQNIDVTIYTQKRSLTKQLKLDLEKYNSQYREIKIEEFNNSHDRFIIIDDVEVYLIGASLKDLGKKWFGFSKMEIESLKVIEKLKEVKNI